MGDIGGKCRDSSIPVLDQPQVDEDAFPGRRVADVDVAQQPPKAVAVADITDELDILASNEPLVRLARLGAKALDRGVWPDGLGRIHADVAQPLDLAADLDHDRVAVDDPLDTSHLAGYARPGHGSRRRPPARSSRLGGARAQ